MQLVIKCPKSGCGDTAMKWSWEYCGHSTLLSDDGDVRRLFNTFSCAAINADPISLTSLLTLVLNVQAQNMEQNMRNILCVTFRLRCFLPLIQLAAVDKPTNKR